MPPLNTLEAIQLTSHRQRKPLFSPVSFKLHAGSILFLHGVNGVGKSTLLRLLSGIITPEQGQVLWQNQSITENKIDYWQKLHFLGHTNGLKTDLTVIENLQLKAALTATHSAGNFDFFLTALKLHKENHTLVKYLSAGQKRRLALAKLFIFTKTIWLLDEPLTALDDHSQQFFLTQLTEHSKKGGISVISSHHTVPLLNVTDLQTLRLTSC